MDPTFIILAIAIFMLGGSGDDDGTSTTQTSTSPTGNCTANASLVAGIRAGMNGSVEAKYRNGPLQAGLAPCFAKYAQEYSFTSRDLAYLIGQCSLETGSWYYLTRIRATGYYQERGAIHLATKRNFERFFTWLGLPANTNPAVINTRNDYAALTAFWYFMFYKGPKGMSCLDIIRSKNMTADQKIRAVSGLVNKGNMEATAQDLARRIQKTKGAAAAMGVTL